MPRSRTKASASKWSRSSLSARATTAAASSLFRLLQLSLCLVAELARPHECGVHRARQHRAHRALLKLVDRGGACATGRGDHVAQLREMPSAPARESGGAFDRAQHELLRDAARESEMHAR